MPSEKMRAGGSLTPQSSGTCAQTRVRPTTRNAGRCTAHSTKESVAACRMGQVRLRKEKIRSKHSWRGRSHGQASSVHAAQLPLSLVAALRSSASVWRVRSEKL
eukprot:5052045-Alexandrium_andersonii.AAC.1